MLCLPLKMSQSSSCMMWSLTKCLQVVLVKISRSVHYLIQDYVPVSNIGDMVIALCMLWVKQGLKEAYLIILWAIQCYDGIGFLIKSESDFCQVTCYNVSLGKILGRAGVFL